MKGSELLISLFEEYNNIVPDDKKISENQYKKKLKSLDKTKTGQTILVLKSQINLIKLEHLEKLKRESKLKVSKDLNQIEKSRITRPVHFKL